MKENAIAASDGMPGGAAVPGARLLVEKLAAYVTRHGAANVRIHLAGHSAGSIYQAAMLARLADAGLKVDTLTWLAPAITVERFREAVLPQLGRTGIVRRFTCFNLSDALELDDTVGPIYHKSAVYLVARGVEDGLGGSVSEVPVLGLTKYWSAPGPAGQALLEEVTARGGQLVVARSAAPADARTDATTHASFDADSPTMTSVAMRVLNVTGSPDEHAFQAYAPLKDPDRAPWSPGTGAVLAGSAPGGPAAARTSASRRRRGAVTRGVGPGVLEAAADAAPGPLRMGAAQPTAAGAPADDDAAGAPPAETAAPGETPLVRTADVPEEVPTAPDSPVGTEPAPEVAAAPRSGSPILDVLDVTGWKKVR